MFCLENLLSLVSCSVPFTQLNVLESRYVLSLYSKPPPILKYEPFLHLTSRFFKCVLVAFIKLVLVAKFSLPCVKIVLFQNSSSLEGNSSQLIIHPTFVDVVVVVDVDVVDVVAVVLVVVVDVVVVELVVVNVVDLVVIFEAIVVVVIDVVVVLICVAVVVVVEVVVDVVVSVVSVGSLPEDDPFVIFYIICVF